MTTLKIKNLHVAISGQEIIKGLDLEVKSGEIHSIMGPNGSGKSTLCYALMGHPSYEITEGEVWLNEENILDLTPDKRAHAGLFLAFQYPREVPGVTFGNFMRIAVNTLRKAKNPDFKPLGPREFYPLIQTALERVKLTRNFIGRSLNEGFSGGEKKRAEVVQMSLLQPKIALLDEIDSGLDIDALKAVAEGIKETHNELQTGILLITHYQRILNYVKPDIIHIMSYGKIVASGGFEIAQTLEEKGYKPFIVD